LWLGVLISSIGTVMQTVGAQWLLVDAPNAATLVALVQAANTLPVMLLAPAGGVLADSFDRRWLLFNVQVYFFIVGIVLAVLTAAGQMPPALLLAFTFALGVGVALQQPSWGATIPELVPRTQLRAASRLDLVNVNLSRATRAGTGRAGHHVPGRGAGRLRAQRAVGGIPGDCPPLLASAAAQNGGPQRAVRSGTPRRWTVRVARACGAPHCAAGDPVRDAGDGIVGAATAGRQPAAWPRGGRLRRVVLRGRGWRDTRRTFLGRVQAGLSTNGTLGAGAVLYAAALAALVVVASFPTALVAMVLAGLAWMAVTSTLQAELQLVLPAWVRARALAMYTVTFMGANAFGALLWGLTADRVGLQPSILLATGVSLLVVVLGYVLRVPETDHLDVQPATYWTDARLAFDPEPHSGAVLVLVHYTVAPERRAAFLEAIGQLRGSRLRTGGTRWDLYRDGARPNGFVEIFSVPSWEEHLRQHAGRLTETDRAIEEAALAFSEPPAYADHLLPP
jgi:MFS family permease